MTGHLGGGGECAEPERVPRQVEAVVPQAVEMPSSPVFEAVLACRQCQEATHPWRRLEMGVEGFELRFELTQPALFVTDQRQLQDVQAVRVGLPSLAAHGEGCLD